ncbi:hypothetical protein ACI4B7_28920, partial [Klebsiella pneumoniae]|uniref:hypothetical protein n=1 Tax=Klebsiella pneumoniae TaxID=573 RepID=UPI0038531DE3
MASNNAYGLPAISSRNTLSPNGLNSNNSYGLNILGIEQYLHPLGLASVNSFGNQSLIPGVAKIY